MKRAITALILAMTGMMVSAQVKAIRYMPISMTEKSVPDSIHVYQFAITTWNGGDSTTVKYMFTDDYGTLPVHPTNKYAMEGIGKRKMKITNIITGAMAVYKIVGYIAEDVGTEQDNVPMSSY